MSENPAGEGLPRDAANWATKVDRLTVGEGGYRGANVAGRRLTGPVQGFGKMWRKTYWIEVSPELSPKTVIATWKEHFGEFWPKASRFQAPLTGLSPGLYELAMSLGGHQKEDRFWIQTLTSLARRLGAASAVVRTRTVCVDRGRQWRNAGQIWHNSMVRTTLRSVTSTFTRRHQPSAAPR